MSVAVPLYDETLAANAIPHGAGVLTLPEAMEYVAGGVYNVKAWGAAGDGVTDDTAAIQAAIDAMSTAYGLGGGVLLLDGEFLISDTLNFTRFTGIVRGNGWGNAPTYTGNFARCGVLRWAPGSGHKPMVKVRDSLNVTFEDLRFQGASVTVNPDDIPTAAINFNYVTGDNKGGNAKLHVRRCYIGVYPWTDYTVDDHVVAVGVLFDGDNSNNDEFSIDGCYLTACTEFGVKVVNTQSTWGQIVNTLIDAGYVYDPSVMVGVYTASDLTMRNVQFNNCLLDIQIVGTASVWIHTYFSEYTQQIATLDNYASLHIFGGDVNMATLTDYAIDIPAALGATLTLRSVDFDLTWSASFPIHVVTGPGAGTYGANITIEDCRDIATSKLSVTLSAANNWCNVQYRNASTSFRNVLVYPDTLDSTLTTVGATVEANAINEYTSAAGVTIDGVLIKDGGIPNGIIAPSWKPAADSTTALQLQNAAGTPIVSVNTTAGSLNVTGGVSATGNVILANNKYFAVRNSVGTAIPVGLVSPVDTFSIGSIGVAAFALTCNTTFRFYPAGVETARVASTGLSVFSSGSTAFSATTLLHAVLETAATDTVSNVLTIGRNTTGTGAAGLGAGQLFTLESDTTAGQNAARIQAITYEAAHATRKYDLVGTAYDAGGEREGWRVRGNGSAAAFSVLGAPPIARIAHVADPTGGATVDAEARAAVNSILATLEGFGFHATS